jgi:hypothetical protein
VWIAFNLVVAHKAVVEEGRERHDSPALRRAPVCTLFKLIKVPVHDPVRDPPMVTNGHEVLYCQLHTAFAKCSHLQDNRGCSAASASALNAAILVRSFAFSAAMEPTYAAAPAAATPPRPWPSSRWPSTTRGQMSCLQLGDAGRSASEGKVTAAVQTPGGGCLAYLHHPTSPSISRACTGCRGSGRRGIGSCNSVRALAHTCMIRVESVRPVRVDETVACTLWHL